MQSGIEMHEAIVGSAVRRFRPIMLTAAAAVLALVPLAGSSFWGPMALAMMGGLLAATVLTLTFLPALYAVVFRVRSPLPRDSRAARHADTVGGQFAEPALRAGE
jgi:multidrug efflux pump